MEPQQIWIYWPNSRLISLCNLIQSNNKCIDLVNVWNESCWHCSRDRPVSWAAMTSSVDRCAKHVWVGNTAEEPVMSATYWHFLPNSKTEKKTSRVDVASACDKRPLGAAQVPPQRKTKHMAAKQAAKSQVAFSLYSSHTRLWNEVSWTENRNEMLSHSVHE